MMGENVMCRPDACLYVVCVRDGLKIPALISSLTPLRALCPLNALCTATAAASSAADGGDDADVSSASSRASIRFDAGVFIRARGDASPEDPPAPAAGLAAATRSSARLSMDSASLLATSFSTLACRLFSAASSPALRRASASSFAFVGAANDDDGPELDDTWADEDASPYKSSRPPAIRLMRGAAAVSASAAACASTEASSSACIATSSASNEPSGFGLGLAGDSLASAAAGFSGDLGFILIGLYVMTGFASPSDSSFFSEAAGNLGFAAPFWTNG
mmetsp:Transcript_3675/g.16127  ORF Transcript_3675/g.16127 Transcript_3675/m.16127 type:complete len:277 (-) Transcript_3675:1470-2300(-)